MLSESWEVSLQSKHIAVLQYLYLAYVHRYGYFENDIDI